MSGKGSRKRPNTANMRHAQARKARIAAQREAADKTEAARLGITVFELQGRRREQRDAIIARQTREAQEAARLMQERQRRGYL